jgi:F-type H+-transporting ATPase subunit b
MRNFCFALCIALFVYTNQAFGSEAGMPQLNPEFWAAQIFWLILIFSSLYFIIWKIFLPKITYSIENRKSRVVNDLDEAQKLKENAEKKLDEYNKIIEESEKKAKKIIEDSKKKLDQDIQSKKQKFIDEIEKELVAAGKEIKDLKKSSISNISNIAAEISAEVIRQIINVEVNKSNVFAIVDDIAKREMEKHI